MTMADNMCSSQSNMSTNMEKLSQTSSKVVESSSSHCSERNGEIHTDSSDEYLSEPLRCGSSENAFVSFNNSLSSTDSASTLIAAESNSFYSCLGDIDPRFIQIPIVGYEIMEERARFTVFKLRIENKASGDCWYVFRRYTDFVRLCSRLKSTHPEIVKHLPRKRWLGNNFDPVFLDERINRLQTLVNAILLDKELLTNQVVQDFFCLNEPPVYSENNEESKALLEALEETISDLKQQLADKEHTMDSLQSSLHSTMLENEHLKKIIRSSTMNCQKCQKECENLNKIMK